MAKEFVLTAQGIDDASEQVAAFLAQTGMAPREAMAARLSFENALVLLHDRLGDGVPATLAVSKMLGYPRLIARVRGAKYDPISAMSELDEQEYGIGRTVLEASGLRPSYAYRSGYNTITLTRPRPPTKRVGPNTHCLCGGRRRFVCGQDRASHPEHFLFARVGCDPAL